MPSTSTARVFNFSAGPAVLPEPVLEEARRDLLALPGAGMSVLEISHRSAVFDRILGQAEADLRRLLDLSDEYHVLFLQGGASQQFAMVPMNLLDAGGVADYVLTGIWAKKAAAEAAKFGTVHVAATTEAQAFTRVPAAGELRPSRDGAYLHVTSNNTITGTQWPELPDAGDRPLVVDASSDLLCRPIDTARCGIIYAGAQKNLGPAGLTLVIIRRDLAQRGRDSLPATLRYALAAQHGSRYNTPPVFAIYLFGLVMRWLLDGGGLDGHGDAQPPQGRAALRRDRPQPVLSRHRADGQPVADERDLPATLRGARATVLGRGGRRGALGAQGTPLGRRSAGVDLQRLSGSGRDGAGRVHGRVRAHPRIGVPGARPAGGQRTAFCVW